MPSDAENLTRADQTFQTRKGHKKVTPDAGMSRGAEGDHVSNHPHRRWADFVERVRQELGWTLEETCDFCGVEIGWLKKARQGQDIRGDFREKLQDALTKKWKERFPDKSALVWPNWVEDAPWSAPGAVASPAQTPTTPPLPREPVGPGLFDPRFSPSDSTAMAAMWSFIVIAVPAARLEYDQAAQRATQARQTTGNGLSFADVLGVEALMWMAAHVDQLALYQEPLLDCATRWVLNPSLTWNIRFRSLALAASLASTPPMFQAYDWCDRIGNCIDGTVDPRGGVCSLIPVAILFGKDQTSLALSNLGVKYHRQSSANVLEHQVLTFCEGLRTCIVIACEREWDLRTCVLERIERTASWIKFDHCHRATATKPVHELRLLLAYANLNQCAKGLSFLRGVPQREGPLSEQLRILWQRFRREDVKQAATLLDDAAKRSHPLWHVEAACLHRPDDWGADGKMSAHRDSFVHFFRVVLNRPNKDKSGAGWSSWVEVMGTFGRLCPDPEICTLAKGMVVIPGG